MTFWWFLVSYMTYYILCRSLPYLCMWFNENLIVFANRFSQCEFSSAYLKICHLKKQIFLNKFPFNFFSLYKTKTLDISSIIKKISLKNKNCYSKSFKKKVTKTYQFHLNWNSTKYIQWVYSFWFIFVYLIWISSSLSRLNQIIS